MKHILNGFIAGFITGGTLFLVTSKRNEIIRQNSFFIGIVTGLAVLGILAAALCRGG